MRQVPQEVYQKYNQLKVEYAEVFRTMVDIDDEKREHNLVLDAIKVF